MPSRKISDLLASAATACTQWQAACRARGVDVLIYCTYRSPQEQDECYAQGRTLPGPIVTKARAWESWHQYRCAWDAIPYTPAHSPDWTYSDRNNDKIPDEPWWRVLVEEAQKLGIEWAGNWTTFKEFCHWQFPNGRTQAQLRPIVEAWPKS